MAFYATTCTRYVALPAVSKLIKWISFLRNDLKNSACTFWPMNIILSWYIGTERLSISCILKIDAKTKSPPQRYLLRSLEFLEGLQQLTANHTRMYLLRTERRKWLHPKLKGSKEFIWTTSFLIRSWVGRSAERQFLMNKTYYVLTKSDVVGCITSTKLVEKCKSSLGLNAWGQIHIEIQKLASCWIAAKSDHKIKLSHLMTNTNTCVVK